MARSEEEVDEEEVAEDLSEIKVSLMRIVWMLLLLKFSKIK